MDELRLDAFEDDRDALPPRQWHMVHSAYLPRVFVS